MSTRPILRDVRILKFRSLRLPIFPNLLIPIRPYPSLLFAILRDLSQLSTIPCYEGHEPYEHSRPTLFNHFVLLTSFLLSLSRLSGKRRDNKTLDDIGTSRRDKNTRK